MRYASLDLWRGLAALLVVVFHAFGSHTHAAYGDYHPVVGAIWMVGSNGWLGVHIFFALSGYCIAAAVDSSVHRGESWLVFLRDRAARIYPAYWGAIAFFMLVGALTAPFIGKSPASALPASWSGFVCDIFLTQPFFTDRYFILVSWSLAYEVCFYLICAVGMMMLLAGWPSSVVFATGGSLAVFGLVSARPLFPLDLWPEFYLGVTGFACLRARQTGRPRSMFFALIFGAVLLSMGFAGKTSYQLAMFATAAVTAVAVVVLYPLDLRLACTRWLRPLAWLGGISYSLYLVHLVVVSKVMNLSKRFVALDSLGVLLAVFLAVAAAVGCAAIFYRTVEAPLEKWRRGLRSAKLGTESQPLRDAPLVVTDRGSRVSGRHP